MLFFSISFIENKNDRIRAGSEGVSKKVILIEWTEYNCSNLDTWGKEKSNKQKQNKNNEINDGMKKGKTNKHNI